MSQTTDPSEHPSQQSSGQPSERSASISRHSRPRTIIEEHDSSGDSDASSHRTPARSTTPVPTYGPQTGYGLRGRVTARKSVPIPIRRTFRIPLRDDAGPSYSRSRSMTSSPSPPPLEDRTLDTQPAGLNPSERHRISSLTSDVQKHGTMIDRHDQNIDALVSMMGTSSQAVHRIIDVLGHTKASVQQLCMIVYLLMTLLVIMFGCLMLRARY